MSLILDGTGSEAAVGTVCIGHSMIHCHGHVRPLRSLTRESENESTMRAKNPDRPVADWRRKGNVDSVELPLIQTGKSLDRPKNKDSSISSELFAMQS